VSVQFIVGFYVHVLESSSILYYHYTLSRGCRKKMEPRCWVNYLVR